ncbi:MAG: hypothetical protein H8E66_33910 [Planctomycetes bacterium]|nr:hypothetical protein [Planctomycetota bacterium]
MKNTSSNAEEGDRLGSTAKWMVGLIISVTIAISSAVGTATVFIVSKLSATEVAITSHSEQLKDLNDNIGKVSSALHEVLSEDVGDLKGRIQVLEQKQILPRAEIEIQRLEERVRKLEHGK